MKDSLSAGIDTTRKFVVDARRTIGFMGEGAKVYATPALVADIEQTCRDMVLPHLDDGEDTVGTRVEIDHLAATLEGMTVEISATVTSVDGRGVSFEITARDPLDKICRCKHNRFVVDVGKTKERLLAKAAKAAGN
ncbi:MAG: thioesterase family protein [Sphingomonadales bacterium]